jgi:hypothetical protein
VCLLLRHDVQNNKPLRTDTLLKSSVFWDVTPCSPLKVNHRFGRICRLQPRGRRVIQTISLLPASPRFIASLILLPWRWRCDMFLWKVGWLSTLESKLCYNRRLVGQSVLVSSTYLGLKARFLFLSNSCGFVDFGRPLWREDGSVVYNCCWPLPAQSFSGPSPAGLMNI